MPTLKELLKSMESLKKTINENPCGGIHSEFQLGQLNTADYVINFIKNY